MLHSASGSRASDLPSECRDDWIWPFVSGKNSGTAFVHQHTDALAAEVAAAAQELRIEVLHTVYRAQTGHLGGPFSAAEIIAALYLHHLRVDPARADWPERDRFLLSKGHAAPILYAVLARQGFIQHEELATFRHFPTRLEGHPDLKLPGVEMVAGPLGHGVAVGAGMAWALSRGMPKPSAASAPSARASRARVYVLLGDGELDAGVVWEGAMTAAKYRLGNLTAIVDANGIQQTGATADVLPVEPLAAKWAAFGWHTQEVHGHNVREVLDALDRADEVHAMPSVIIARTTKGRGVSFMEYDHRWHGGVLTRELYDQALTELEAGLDR
jgi:transketolase